MPKSKRRANGDGTIFRVRDGRWGAAIWETYLNGQRKRKYFYSRDRPKCVEWLATKRVQLSQGLIALDSDTPLTDWLWSWLERYTPNIRTSTRTSYCGYIKNHLSVHKIGAIPLGKLTVDVLQRFVNEMSTGKSAVSAKTVRNLMQMLRAALKQAVGNGMIVRNPADYVQLPRVKQIEIQTLTDEEISQVLNSSRGDRNYLAMVLLLFFGLRLGELLALRHSSLCEADGIWFLRITHSLNRVANPDSIGNDNAPKTALILEEPKSASSKREIPLLPEIRSVVDQHIARQKRDAERTYGLYETDPFLISNELGGCIDPTTFRTWFNKTVETAGITRHIRIHDCRHTAATIMLRSGMTPHEVSLIIGHSSSQITEKVYLHPTISDRNKAISDLGQTLIGFLN